MNRRNKGKMGEREGRKDKTPSPGFFFCISMDPLGPVVSVRRKGRRGKGRWRKRRKGRKWDRDEDGGEEGEEEEMKRIRENNIQMG